MVSHQHKCVFVHIPKTAGQSIETVFLNSLGLTWDTRAPLLLRSNDEPRLGPPRLAHLAASEYVRYKYITQAQYDAYFKFSFVRNPWSRAVSFYKYFGYAGMCSFRWFVKRYLQKKLWTDQYWFVRPQCEFITDAEGTLLVDYVGRFESLQVDFDHVCEKVGLSNTLLPRVNQSSRTRRGPGVPIRSLMEIAAGLWTRHGMKSDRHNRSLQDLYDDESKDIVSELYAGDIKAFHYTFPSH